MLERELFALTFTWIGRKKNFSAATLTAHHAPACRSTLHLKSLLVYAVKLTNEAMTPASNSPTTADPPALETGEETKRATSPPRRLRTMPGGTTHTGALQAKPVVHPVISSAQAGGSKSLQWTNPKDTRGKGEDVKTRLQKAEEDLKKAKEVLKAHEMQARARKQKHAKHNAEEELRIKVQSVEEDLRVKIQRTKEGLRVKEETAAARRARKNATRDAFLRGNFEVREAKRQENARVKAQAHGAETDGDQMASTGAAEETVVKKEDFDTDFDIDIYMDE